MKKIFFALAFVALLACCAFAQSVQMSFTNTIGDLYATAGHAIALSAASVTSGTRNGNDVFEAGDVGRVNFTTPPFQHGSTATGGTFGVGGSFEISTLYGASLNAHFLGGEWRMVKVSPGVNQFVLTATIAGTLLLDNGVSLPVRGHTVQLSPSAPGNFVGFVFGAGGDTSVSGGP